MDVELVIIELHVDPQLSVPDQSSQFIKKGRIFPKECYEINRNVKSVRTFSELLHDNILLLAKLACLGSTEEVTMERF